VIPVSVVSLLVSNSPLEVPKLVAAWKGLDESSEATVVLNG
jgi:hypothetical protein